MTTTTGAPKPTISPAARQPQDRRRKAPLTLRTTSTTRMVSAHHVEALRDLASLLRETDAAASPTAVQSEPHTNPHTTHRLTSISGPSAGAAAAASPDDVSNDVPTANSSATLAARSVA